MNYNAYARQRGFTIVELLIAIVVIGILAAISVVAYNGVAAKARDAKRAGDIANIKKALMAYNQTHGGVPKTTTYGAGYDGGGWDHSRRPEWLSFLGSDYGNMPVDPENTFSNGIDPGNSGNRAYHYYCYPNYGGESNIVRLRYHDSRGVIVEHRFQVDACL